MGDYARMDDALEFLAPYGPDLRNGMTSHAPMVVEALAALGRADAVMPWLQASRPQLTPRPAPSQPIAPAAWRDALGREERAADWAAFFEAACRETPWTAVVARWIPRLCPGICAAAAHGVIRTGHAVRSLADADTPGRVRELAAALGYWAATYQTLPAAEGSGEPQAAGRAIAAVPILPPERRRFRGTIVSALAALDDFPAFAPVIGLLDASGAPASVCSELTETFARVYLAAARDPLHAIVFVHGVTGVTALRSILPYLPDAAARDAVRHAWQSSCALQATFGAGPPSDEPPEPPRETPDELVERALATGDDHAIKFTEACLREHALRPSPAYLAAARHAIGALVGT